MQRCSFLFPPSTNTFLRRSYLPPSTIPMLQTRISRRVPIIIRRWAMVVCSCPKLRRFLSILQEHYTCSPRRCLRSSHVQLVRIRMALPRRRADATSLPAIQQSIPRHHRVKIPTRRTTHQRMIHPKSNKWRRIKKKKRKIFLRHWANHSHVPLLMHH